MRSPGELSIRCLKIIVEVGAKVRSDRSQEVARMRDIIA